MLYGIGMTLVFVSAAFCEGAVLVPLTMVAIGVALMIIGRRTDNGKSETGNRRS